MDTDGNESKGEEAEEVDDRKLPTFRMESLQYEGGGKDSAKTVKSSSGQRAHVRASKSNFRSTQNGP